MIRCIDLSNERSCLQQFEGQAVAITGLVRDHKATHSGHSNVLLINVSVSELSTTTKMEDRQRFFYQHLWIKVPNEIDQNTKSATAIGTHIGGIARCERYFRQDGTYAYGLRYEVFLNTTICEQALLETLHQNLNKIRFADIPYSKKLEHVMALSKSAQDLINSNSVYTFEYTNEELIDMTSVKTMRTKIGMIMPSNRAGRRAQNRLRKKYPLLQLA